MFKVNPSANELKQAKLIYSTQSEYFAKNIKVLSSGERLPKDFVLSKLDSFIDTQGLLRVKGRIGYSALAYKTKHPVVGTKGHLSKLCIRIV